MHLHLLIRGYLEKVFAATATCTNVYIDWRNVAYTIDDLTMQQGCVRPGTGVPTYARWEKAICSHPASLTLHCITALIPLISNQQSHSIFIKKR